MTRLSQARRHYAGIAEKVSGGTGSGAGDLAGPGASGTPQTGRHLHGLFQVFALPAHRGPVPGGLRLEWYASPPGDGLDFVYIDQIRANDVSKSRLEKFPSMKLYPTIPEALTLGGSKLAVDGLILVGEHGQYPRNEKGQTQYPRYPFFQEIVKVFRASGRSVPVFNDKHLSWNWDWAREMYDTSRSMGFPFIAGSSLPVTWRTPSLEMPLGSRVREAMCVCHGGVDSYDFHGLETIQCMVERRRGGKSGVKG